MRTLALDLGDRRIGVALSDATGTLARPLEVFQRRSRAADFAHVAALVQQHEVGAVVIGLPFNMNGTEGQRAAWTRDYGAALGQAVERPVTFWDERLTTVEAEELLQAQGRQSEKRSVDAIAAAIILQGYLDHLRDEEK
ncbi:MAG: Holliday junction resolvase RuvX [Chloroflexi bacterium]|nr:Holliday junction resolvase RuvX [Chloroflexota bacterium]OQB02300.1 MAG: putative Holliday junction resolvase [Chloroflexi bacterium ADurb.Bin222]